MPKNSPLPVPQPGKMLQWAMANEAGIIAMVQWYNKMQALEMGLVTPGGYNLAKKALLEGGDNIALPLPYKLPNSWAVATGTPLRTTFATSTVTTAQLAGRVMAMEQDFIATGMMPTA